MSTAAGHAREAREPGLAQEAAAVFLGVHDGHNASVAAVREGRLVFALQEERLSRIKNHGDVPQRALGEFFGQLPFPRTELRVALAGRYMNYGQWDRARVLADYRRDSALLARWKQPLKGTLIDRIYQKRKAAERRQRLEAAGLPGPAQTAIEHHEAHAAAAYYAAPFPEVRAERGKVLVFTCDGSGDRLSATVSVGEGGVLYRLAAVSEHDSIGRLYSQVTRRLGMLPLEHEYKLMGLAPYAAGARSSAEIARRLEGLFEFDKNGLAWRRRRGVPSMYAAGEFLDRLLANQRFDWIAAGTQLFLERMLAAWVRAAVRETGVRKIACAGGVFMNVKANLAILELPEVEEMFVFPSCGDESNSIGAAYLAAARAGERIEPLGAIYYGAPITDREAEEALVARANARIRFCWEPEIERWTARQLAAGHIVARAHGAMEFGARALGNRSILAPANRPELVRVINEAIKNRDFWMPFAPSIAAAQASRYLLKAKPVASPYMMFAFRTRPQARSAMAAAQHPCDFTARAHEVSPTHNPSYHRLLEEYEAITGEAVVLNTSFNLHGEPIVSGAADAVDVFLRSGLERMALANWRVEKIA